MPKRILLVDDSRVVRETARELFESAGFVCDEAEDGAKAIEEASVFHSDLIVLDLAMPTMDGLQAAPRLRQMLPFGPDNPIHRCMAEAYWKSGREKLASRLLCRRIKWHPSWWVKPRHCSTLKG